MTLAPMKRVDPATAARTADTSTRPNPRHNGLLPASEIVGIVKDLEQLHTPLMESRRLTRDLLSGGERAVTAILGEKAVEKAKSQGKDPYRLLPISNLLLKAMERQAQRTGVPPTLKVLPPQDTKKSRAAAERREMVVEWLDHESRLELQLPVYSRWTPGYGYSVWILRQRRTPEGIAYVHAAPRDPFECYLSEWGPDREPSTLAVKRRIPLRTLQKRFGRRVPTTSGHGRVVATATDSDHGEWEGTAHSSDAHTIWEVYHPTGIYILHWDSNTLLGAWPNPLNRPPFVAERRATFGRLHGQWEDHIGMMSSLARLHALAVIFAQDSVFTETNVVGEVLSGKYRHGRGVVNKLSPGSEVSKPVNQTSFQIFTQIDRVERLLRNAASYPVAADGEAPMSFLTGQGIDNLLGGISSEVREYNTIRRWALQELDSKRLEWDEKVYGDTKRILTGDRKGAPFSVEYNPAEDIAGNWRTHRKFGAMAGFDEPQKIVAGLQLLTAEVLDPETLAEELDGIDNYQRIQERKTRTKSVDRLYDVLSARAEQGDPQATMALVELAKNPSKLQDVLDKFFTPEGPQLSPEEQQMIGQGGGGQPDLQTILSRLTLSGQPQGGVQTVATRGG